MCEALSAPLGPDPAVLPGDRDAAVVAAVADVGAVAEAELERLVRGERHGGSHADAGIALIGEVVLHTVEAGHAARPVVRVQRNPEPRSDVVAQMRFHG